MEHSYQSEAEMRECQIKGNFICAMNCEQISLEVREEACKHYFKLPAPKSVEDILI